MCDGRENLLGCEPQLQRVDFGVGRFVHLCRVQLHPDYHAGPHVAVADVAAEGRAA